MKKYLVVGAGKQSKAITHDLLRDPAAESVLLVDRDDGCLADVLGHRRDPRLSGLRADAADRAAMERLMASCDVVINASHYRLNVGLTRAAIAAGAHYCDLGGNVEAVRTQFALDGDAKKAGVAVLPDCGIAPGAVSVLARLAIDRLGGTADAVGIRVGGLPQRPVGPLGYALVFSVGGLINECLEDCEVLRNGRLTMAKAMCEDEEQGFPHPFGTLVAANTSGGLSTLAHTYAGKVRDLDYKTLRYPGHWPQMRLLRDLGYWGSSPIDAGGTMVAPRAVTEALLEKALPRGVPDALVLRVFAAKGADRVQYDMIDLADAATGHSAMQRTTGYSVAILARMLAEGEIAGPGVLKHEIDVPPARFLEEWKARGIIVTETA